MARLMKHYKRLIIAELIFILALLLCPIVLVINGASMNKIPNMKRSEWIFPEPDNLLFTEDLDVKILKDGSVSKMWSLVDHGIGNITFPFKLPTPVNSSSLALLDFRVRLAVVQHERFPTPWGPITYRDESYEFIFDDDIDSIIPHIFLEFYALIDDVVNQSLVFPLFTNITSGLESMFEVDFLKFAEITGPRITQIWRAFPSADIFKTVFEYLLDNNLPTNVGLLKVDKEKFLNSKHKSIHIAANWDGHNDSGSDSYDQEPSLPGTTEDLDDRWELIAGIYEYDSEEITIKEGSENTVHIKDIIPFIETLPSHPEANSSVLEIDFYHGSTLLEADPNFENSPKYRSRYTLDMLSDSGLGSDYELPDDSMIIFKDGMDEVPVLTVEVSMDQQLIPFGENFTITYDITNIGMSTAYNVDFEDDFFGLFPSNFTIYEGDCDSDGDVDMSWTKIEPGESETHRTKIYCNGSGFYLTNPELEYHASTYADIDEWLRNPNDLSGGYQIDGQTALIVCNDSAAILTLELKTPKTTLVVGDSFNVNMTIRNIGDKNATNINWTTPFIGINTTPATGYINTIVPNEIIEVNTTFYVDHPSRFMGDFIELRFNPMYRGAFVSYWYSNGTRFSRIDAKETPLNIFPRTEQEYGSLVVLKKELSQIMISGKEYYQVTIYVKNSGDTTAFNVDVNDIYPIENFAIISGSTSETWNFLPPNIEFSYSYIVEYPVGISSDVQVSYLTATYDYSYFWYSGSSWEESFDFSTYDAAEAIGDIFGIILVLGFMSATTIAVILGVYMLRKQGFLGG